MGLRKDAVRIWNGIKGSDFRGDGDKFQDFIPKKKEQCW